MIKYWLDNPNHEELQRGSKYAAGWDLVARSEHCVSPGARLLVPTGLYLSMSPGICAMVCSRSGLAIKHGVIVLNAPGIIDADYRGEVMVSLINLSREPHTVLSEDRIAQLVFAPVFPLFILEPGATFASMLPSRVESMAELGVTDRGSGGHGSTGV